MEERALTYRDWGYTLDWPTCGARCLNTGVLFLPSRSKYSTTRSCNHSCKIRRQSCKVRKLRGDGPLLAAAAAATAGCCVGAEEGEQDGAEVARSPCVSVPNVFSWQSMPSLLQFYG